jgi:hypothetical protein
MTPAAVLTRALRYEAILTVAVIVVGGAIGYLIAGTHGLFGALIGGGATAVFMGLTAASILIAGRVAPGADGIALFYGIVLGTWMLKLVLFVALAIWLRGQSWLDPAVFGVTVIAAVIASLILDIVAFQRTRVPYTDASLPGEGHSSPEKSHSDS